MLNSTLSALALQPPPQTTRARRRVSGSKATFRMCCSRAGIEPRSRQAIRECIAYGYRGVKGRRLKEMYLGRDRFGPVVGGLNVPGGIAILKRLITV